jgi:hypothetical protein
MNDQDFASLWRWQPGLSAHLRFPFEGAASIQQNHSQAWQDLFVLSMLRGMRGGRYLEIGAQVPVVNNNTFLLHDDFGWSGVSVELDPSHFPAWQEERPAGTFVIADALRLDYADALQQWFGDVRRVEYLQLDIDPSSNTLQVLQRMALDMFRFSVITFETDAYSGDLRARNESRAILQSHGYELVLADARVLFPPAGPEPLAFEDWWVDPQAVDLATIKSARSAGSAAGGLPQRLLFSGGR